MTTLQIEINYFQEVNEAEEEYNNKVYSQWLLTVDFVKLAKEEMQQKISIAKENRRLAYEALLTA